MAAPLKNKYWILRHGFSIPNEMGLIVSDMNNGTLPQYGLAITGFAQARAAGQNFLKELEQLGLSKVAIYSSPFTRTKETANCVAEVLAPICGSLQIQFVDELKERYFGPPLELQSHLRYPGIWELDASDPFVGPEGGESVADVASRVSRVIPRIESERQGEAVLLVSHGDTLQILQAVVPYNSSDYTASVLSQHRKYGLLTGELRRLF